MKKRTFIKNMAILSLGTGVAPSILLSCAKKKNVDNQPNLLPLKLPDLSFKYNDLEPYIDALTMEIHHQKHHQGYINKLKKALDEKTVAIDPKELFAGEGLSDTIRNNGGGHYNHTFFWETLTPKTTYPSTAFSDMTKKYFGSLQGLKDGLKEIGKSIFGSGWVWLIKNNKGILELVTTPNQDNPLMRVSVSQGIPLLGIDVWEHAYYLKYHNERGNYLQNVTNIINWKTVSERFSETEKIS